MARKKSHNKKLPRSVVSALAVLVLLAISYMLNSDAFAKFQQSNNFDTSKDFVSVMDVGQGESILIYSDGYCAVYDVGTEESSERICANLKACGIKTIDVLMVSHLHTDHIGGAKTVADTFNVKNLILPEISTQSEGLSYAQYVINKVTALGGETYTAKSGMNFKIGDFEITVLAAYDMDDENNRSVIAVAEMDGKKFLFTGDAEVKVEQKLLSEGLNLKCDVLSVGHHGSSTSSSSEFLRAVAPQYAAISAGKDNMYGHPHNETLALLERNGAKVLRTDINGDITFYVENGIIVPVTKE